MSVKRNIVHNKKRRKFMTTPEARAQRCFNWVRKVCKVELDDFMKWQIRMYFYK